MSKIFKSKYYFVYIFLLINLTSCDDTRFNTHYSGTLRGFKTEFIDHFPLEIGKGKIYYNKNYDYDVTKLFLHQKIANDQFFYLYDSIEISSIANYNSSDSCLLVINMFTTTINYPKEKKATKNELELLNDKCLSNKSPVPNFWPLDIDSTTRCKLPKGFELFVLEARSGVYWDEKYLLDGKYMPEDWKHGYSKGIAMNKGTLEVIYWFVIW